MTLGIIGGSGLYQIDGVKDAREVQIDTPYGPPSAPLIFGTIGPSKVVFLPRHGRGHTTPPHQINYRANVCALKQAGVTQVVSVSAVGSLKESIAPGHVVIVDQYIDLTRHRVSTFFEDGIAGHVGFGEPTCPQLTSAAADAASRVGAIVHRGGTYVCIDGPQFSSRAESFLYKSWGASVIGMTAMPEAKLCREAALPYCTIALSTDYDCWHETEADVTVGAVLEVMKANVALSGRLLVELCSSLPRSEDSPLQGAGAAAVITSADAVSSDVRARLGWLLDIQE